MWYIVRWGANFPNGGSWFGPALLTNLPILSGRWIRIRLISTSNTFQMLSRPFQFRPFQHSTRSRMRGASRAYLLHRYVYWPLCQRLITCPCHTYPSFSGVDNHRWVSQVRRLMFHSQTTRRSSYRLAKHPATSLTSYRCLRQCQPASLSGLLRFLCYLLGRGIWRLHSALISKSLPGFIHFIVISLGFLSRYESSFRRWKSITTILAGLAASSLLTFPFFAMPPK